MYSPAILHRYNVILLGGIASSSNVQVRIESFFQITGPAEVVQMLCGDLRQIFRYETEVCTVKDPAALICTNRNTASNQ